MKTLTQIQAEQKSWQEHNFPNRESWNPLVGMMEELGELSHAHLKLHQQIRMGEDHLAKAKDAIGDIMIFLLDYCSAHNFNAEEIINETWEEVSKRDWRKNNVTGK